MSFDAGFMLGLSMGGGGGEPEEDWTPPADWPVVPEPGDYEMYFLIDIRGCSAGFFIHGDRTDNRKFGCGCAKHRLGRWINFGICR